MGFRFQRRLSLGKFVRLNFSKSGVSTSLGIKGARMTFGRTGTRTTVGLPGSGMSYTHLSRPTRREFWGPQPHKSDPHPDYFQSSPYRPPWLKLALWIAAVSLLLWAL